MELLVRGTDVTISPELRSYATSRLSKLDRLIEHLVDAKLELKKTHQRNGGAIVAQLTVQTGRDLLRAEERDQDARKAINLVADKMATQVRKVNDRRTARRKSTAPLAEIEPIEPVELDATDVDRDDGDALVRTKRFKIQPLDVDEAIEQMELLGHDFFVFHNVDGASVNVVYRRNDGSYGLLVPLSA